MSKKSLQSSIILLLIVQILLCQNKTAELSRYRHNSQEKRNLVDYCLRNQNSQNSFFCFGISADDTKNVCSGHGKCVGTDLCVCNREYHSGFVGKFCQFPLVFQSSISCEAILTYFILFQSSSTTQQILPGRVGGIIHYSGIDANQTLDDPSYITMPPSTVPTRIQFEDESLNKNPKTSKWVKVASGISHTLTLDADGRVYSIGGNIKGQLGYQLDSSNTIKFRKIQFPNSNNGEEMKIIDIAAGGSFNYAIDSFGNVVAWGGNEAGQLGNNTYDLDSHFTPIPIQFFNSPEFVGAKVVMLSAGAGHGLAVSSTGSVYSWGSKTSGQLGQGLVIQNVKFLVPTKIKYFENNNITVVYAYAGYMHSLFIDSEGRCYCTGSSKDGECATGSKIALQLPERINYSGKYLTLDKTIVGVTAHRGLSVFLDSDGKLYSAGGGGLLGNGDTLTNAIPVAVDDSGVLAGKRVVQMATNGARSTILIAESTEPQKNGYDQEYNLFGFGPNDRGQIGDGTQIPRLSAVQVACPVGISNQTSPNNPPKCNIYSCFDAGLNETSLCSGHGQCLYPEICECSKGLFSGNKCQFPYCFGKTVGSSQIVCSGHGVCTKPDFCNCDEGYTGLECSEMTMVKTILTALFGVQLFFKEKPIFLGIVAVAVAILGTFVLVAICCCCVFCSTQFIFCSFGLPSLLCCTCCAARKLYQKKIAKQKKEILQKLLDGAGNPSVTISSNSSEMIEISTPHDEKQTNYDMSLFNLDFKDFKIVEELTSGGSGALCMEAIDKRNDENVFIKLFAMRSNSDDENDFGQFRNEINLFLRLRHPNIVTFFGMFYSPPSRVGYVCEFCKQGTLHGFLKKLKKNSTPFPFSKKLDWLIQIGQGMRYLHQKNVVFRDLKPENILIGKGDVLKLTDFGISKIIDKNAKNDAIMTKNAGTSFYMAPEVVLQNEQHYDQKVDVFSFGIVMFEILFETVQPFGDESNLYGIEFKVSQDPNFRPKIPNISPKNAEEKQMLHQLTDLMKKCWEHDPTKRPEFREIVNNLSTIQEIGK